MRSYRTLDPEVVRIFTEIGEMHELARVFVAREQKRLSEMRRVLAEEDLRELAALAHGLTGTAGSVGAYGLAKLSRRLEGLARESTCAECSDLVESLEDEFRRVVSDLRSLLAEAKRHEPHEGT